MIKLLGAILMVGATTWAGLGASHSIKRRELTLRAFALAMEQMAARLSFDMALLPQVLEQMSHSGPELTRSFFKVCLAGMADLEERPFSLIWERSVHTACEGLCKAGKQTLCEAGAIIGRYGIEAQLGALTACVSRLRTLADSAAGESAAKSRIYTGLGVCSGLMAVIVLI